MRRKQIYFVAAIVFLVLAAICFWLALPNKPTPQTATNDPIESTATTSSIAATTTVTQPAYISPIDFKRKQEQNPDIYAWISIPGTRVNYPVVQSATDDSFYLDHDSDKKYNLNGAIFSEHLYNSTDFTDAVTVLYGHNMKSGEMFGDFQSLYWDEEFLKENDDIIIYLPDREIHFEIFAATPFSRLHILHYYHAEKERAFEMLIDDIYSSRQLSAVLIEERRPEYGDQVLILSTCLSGNNHYRYLVMGVCKDGLK